MNPIRLFSKLGAKTQDIYSNGKSETIALPLEYAFYCRRMNPLHFKAAMLKWGGDWYGANELERELWIHGAGIASQQGWRVPVGGEFIRKMAGMVLLETVRPSYYSHDLAWAAELKIEPRLWQKVWKRRYNDLFNEFDGWCHSAYQSVKALEEYQEESIDAS